MDYNYDDDFGSSYMGTNSLPYDETFTDESYRKIIESLPCDKLKKYIKKHNKYLKYTQELLDLFTHYKVNNPNKLLQYIKNNEFNCVDKDKKRKLKYLELYDNIFEWRPMLIILLILVSGIIVLYKLADKHCFTDSVSLKI
jgi:hypothetical protein